LINSGSKNRKSASSANATIMAVSCPIPEFNSKDEKASIENPAIRTTDVMISARPTVDKA